MINTVAKIIAIPLKIVSILLSLLLIFAPIAKAAGIIFYILIIPVVGLGLFAYETPKYEMVFTALLFPTILTFAGTAIKGLIYLNERFSNWLINTDHRSARVQNEEFIRKMELEKLRSQPRDGVEEEIREYERILREIHEKGG